MPTSMEPSAGVFKASASSWERRSFIAGSHRSPFARLVNWAHTLVVSPSARALRYVLAVLLIFSSF
jgi:hypothetical protein